MSGQVCMRRLAGWAGLPPRRREVPRQVLGWGGPTAELPEGSGRGPQAVGLENWPRCPETSWEQSWWGEMFEEDILKFWGTRG